jgi:hypothetical protein
MFFILTPLEIIHWGIKNDVRYCQNFTTPYHSQNPGDLFLQISLTPQVFVQKYLKFFLFQMKKTKIKILQAASSSPKYGSFVNCDSVAAPLNENQQDNSKYFVTVSPILKFAANKQKYSFKNG